MFKQVPLPISKFQNPVKNSTYAIITSFFLITTGTRNLADFSCSVLYDQNWSLFTDTSYSILAQV
jgi:hypothetical protein